MNLKQRRIKNIAATSCKQCQISNNHYIVLLGCGTFTVGTLHEIKIFDVLRPEKQVRFYVLAVPELVYTYSCATTWIYTWMNELVQNPTKNQCTSITGAHDLGGHCVMLAVTTWKFHQTDNIEYLTCQKQAKHVAARDCKSSENNRGHESSAWREKTEGLFDMSTTRQTCRSQEM